MKWLKVGRQGPGELTEFYEDIAEDLNCGSY